MSTSEQFSGLPDPGILEQLANEYFKKTTSPESAGLPTGSEHVTLLPSASLPYSAISAAPFNAAPSGYAAQPLTGYTAPNTGSSLAPSDLEGIPASLTPSGTDPRGYIPSTPVAPREMSGAAGLPGSSTFSFL